MVRSCLLLHQSDLAHDVTSCQQPVSGASRAGRCHCLCKHEVLFRDVSELCGSKEMLKSMVRHFDIGAARLKDAIEHQFN